MADFFWDTSALAKHYHDEPGSDFVRPLLEPASGHQHFISEITIVEMLSVAAAKIRSRELAPEFLAILRKVFADDIGQRIVRLVRLDSRLVRVAQSLLSKHAVTEGIGLRTLDAVQLASALALKRPLHFVSSDKRLLRAVEQEGFERVNPETE